MGEAQSCLASCDAKRAKKVYCSLAANVCRWPVGTLQIDMSDALLYLKLEAAAAEVGAANEQRR